jgi:DNA replication protein DnaD
MNYELKYTLPGPDVISLSGQTINKLLRSGDSDAALLYLYILKTEGKSTAEETMTALGKGMGWINSAMATLSRIGLIHLDKNENETHSTNGALDNNPDEPDAAEHLSTENMRRELEAGTEFTNIIEETQKNLGRLLSPDDLMRMYGIYDNLNMPPEVIMQLITYYINEGKRTGAGRVPTVRYIEKAAYTWAREGILTLDMAEKHIKKLEARRSIRGEIKAAMQIRDRELSTTERKYVDSWIVMGFDVGAVEIAYDRTLVKTGKLAWSYMDSIMQSWHNRELHTANEIMEKDTGTSKTKKFSTSNNRQTPQAPNQDEIDYMQRLLDKMKNE